MLSRFAKTGRLVLARAASGRSLTTPGQRTISNSRCNSNSKKLEASHVDVEELLAQPTWSVSSLLPPKDLPRDTTTISSKQLHHLLRLSALPPPKDEQEQAEMIRTLQSQLHFVKDIQKVGTTGVEPFWGLHDETAEGEKEAELGLAAMHEALDQEEVRGKHHKRIKRKREDSTSNAQTSWNVLDTAEKKVGRYFVVEGGSKEG